MSQATRSGETATVHTRPASGGKRGPLGTMARVLILAGLLVLTACTANATTIKVSSAAKVQDGTSGHYKATQYPLHWNPSRPFSLYNVANQYLAHMTLDQELGQLFFAAFSGTTYNSSNAAMVQQQGIGGMILYAANVTSKTQTTKLIATAQANAQIPMLVMTDEEGGWVDRLQHLYGWRPTPTQIGATNDPTYAKQQGQKAGQDMSVLGFNADFAPDVDVQQVAGPDQITRTFGTTPQQVTKMAGAWMTGMQSAGVAVCLKHFPGLGDAKIDAHLGLPVIKETLPQIEAIDLAPYRALIATGQVQMIMTTDLLMPALDPKLPAELSPTIIDGVLRQQMGYNGVVVTDALYMAGISAKWSEPQAGVLAIEAGDDMLVGAFSPYMVSLTISALKAAMSSGQLTKARIDESVRRILTLKMRMGLLPIPMGVVPVPPLGSMTAQITDGPVTLPPQP